MSTFDRLNKLNVNEHVEKKIQSGTSLSYLSWAWAWAETLKAYPDASYTIWKDEQNRPYIYDEKTGYMVFTTVTIDGITHEMWLPVMDGANRAMKAEPYTYKTKYKESTVQAASMMDINKTIMRCLTKNLAMFGLGLYIYAGEDLPEGDEPKEPPKNAEVKTDRISQITLISIKKFLEEHNIDEEYILESFNINGLEELTDKQHYIIVNNKEVLKERAHKWSESKQRRG